MINNLYLDNGNDYNKDKHCDIDGWFVNKDGHHVGVLRTFKTKDGISFGPLYGDDVIKSAFNISVPFESLNLKELSDYTTNSESIKYSSPEMNRQLRGINQITPDMFLRVCKIYKLFDYFTLNRQIKVFRAISSTSKAGWMSNIINLKPGDIYFDAAFMSTTYSNLTPISFLLKSLYSKELVIFDIDVKPGTHCIPLYHGVISKSTEDEYEILFNRFQSFKVKKVLKNTISDCNVYTIQMETF